MKHGTMKTLGVAALGAAFAAAGGGTASAAGVTDDVEAATGKALSAPPMQQAVEGGDSVAGAPAETGQSAPQPLGLLGGMPVDGQMGENSLPGDAVTGGGLPTDALSGNTLPTDGLTGGGLPTDGLTGGGLPLG